MVALNVYVQAGMKQGTQVQRELTGAQVPRFDEDGAQTLQLHPDVRALVMQKILAMHGTG